jgi:hypothetical protein
MMDVNRSCASIVYIYRAVTNKYIMPATAGRLSLIIKIYFSPQKNLFVYHERRYITTDCSDGDCYACDGDCDAAAVTTCLQMSFMRNRCTHCFLYHTCGAKELISFPSFLSSASLYLMNKTITLPLSTDVLDL